jgi:uncharacterized protein (TIGR02266 family)
MANLYIAQGGNIEEVPSSGEKRYNFRFPVRVAVRYGKEDPITCNGFILNLSEGGVFIQTDEPLPVNSEILIRLFIPPRIKLLGEFTGKVAWVNTGESPLPKGMGIQFETPGKEALKQLISYFRDEKPLIDQKA